MGGGSKGVEKSLQRMKDNFMKTLHYSFHEDAIFGVTGILAILSLMWPTIYGSFVVF